MTPTKTTKILQARFASGRTVTATMTENRTYEGQIQVDVYPNDNKEHKGYAMSSEWDEEAKPALLFTLELLTRISRETKDPVIQLATFGSFKFKK